ncbi:MAG: APC family permease [Stigonema ocellatum SAG 48.90 = DSM 106950]|nr:APC family permease [Stigonema ocellatum SAG 48.90 = DSM 106950]
MSFYSRIKQFLLGRTLPTSANHEERLSNAAALAVLSSDALSSVAYATEEILKVLVLAGSAVLGNSIWIALAIALLLLIITLSYQQTIRAYPSGGGAYIVAHENLGIYPGLVAAAALMIDYVLTVTVSIASGVDNLTSIPMLQRLQHFKVELCLIFIILIMLANLRGVRESGRIFMIPTYAFIVSVFLMLGVGFYNQATGQIHANPPVIQAAEPLGLLLILRAFSQGCTALTGVEAISNGVPAFKPPEWKNARLTMLYMGLILGSMFLGITHFANVYHIVPNEHETVISQLSHNILGNGPSYNFIQIATLLILLLAANTSYADFPRLSSLLARDGFLPRQLALLGERLVYSNGIVLLSLFGAVLIVVFKGSVDRLISLYAVGVFTSFTLSQAGMVRHWFKEHSSGWHARAFMNALGAITTAVVLLVILQTKFLAGAWIVAVAIPLIVSIFLAIRRYYHHLGERLSVEGIPPRDYTPRPKPEVVTHPAVVIVGQLNLGTVEALDYARTIADEIVAVHVDLGYTDQEKLQEQWRKLESDIPLEIIDSPYRALIEPILNFISDFEARHPSVFTTIIIPAFVPHHWWESFLHNQTAVFLKTALRAQKSRVVTTVRYYL